MRLSSPHALEVYEKSQTVMGWVQAWLYGHPSKLKVVDPSTIVQWMYRHGSIWPPNYDLFELVEDALQQLGASKRLRDYRNRWTFGDSDPVYRRQPGER